MTDTDYSEDVAAVASAIAAVYENKQVNKKNNISGDFSSDNVSYPTVKAVKDYVDGEIPSKTSDLTNDGDDGSNAFVKTNDSRLSNARTPTSHTHGNLSNDGKIGSASGKIITTGNNGALQASDNLSAGDIKDSTAHSHIGSSANATQATINAAIDNKLNIDVVKQQTPETGYASTYYITQNGTQVGAKINIEKDKMVRSISVETVGSTPTSEETSYNMTTGDQYILMIVNTVDNDGTSRLVLPITDVFDLQTADETTLTLSAGGVFSIKSGGVDTAQLKNGAVTSDKIASSVKNGWLTASDVQSEINAFAAALAEAINPSS